MDGISEKCAVEISWETVCRIVSEEIEKILGLRVQCKAQILTEDSFWDVTFVDYRLPFPKLCLLIQAIQATPEEWADTMPEDGVADINGLGMTLAEKLLARKLKLTWEHQLITSGSLWLIGVTKMPDTEKNI